MLRRDFLKGTAAVIATGVTGNASAQELKLPAHLLDIIRVNFCQGEPKTRRNVYTLYNSNPNHPIIEAYRQGVAVMRGRAPSDPLSWDYQANIHGTTLAQTSWPPGAPFATCEHNTNFFLS
jgi:TAT (twin-arginine translocation) pathway signal sequence